MYFYSFISRNLMPQRVEMCNAAECKPIEGVSDTLIDPLVEEKATGAGAIAL
jgi:hypothetical protein